MKTKAEYILEQWNLIDLYGLSLGFGHKREVAVANKCKCSISDVRCVLAIEFEHIITGEPIEEIVARYKNE